MGVAVFPWPCCGWQGELRESWSPAAFSLQNREKFFVFFAISVLGDVVSGARKRRESMVHNAVLSSWFLLETGRDNDDGGSHNTARSRAWHSRQESPPADPGIKARSWKPWKHLTKSYFLQCKQLSSTFHNQVIISRSMQHTSFQSSHSHDTFSSYTISFSKNSAVKGVKDRKHPRWEWTPSSLWTPLSHPRTHSGNLCATNIPAEYFMGWPPCSLAGRGVCVPHCHWSSSPLCFCTDESAPDSMTLWADSGG